MVEVSEVVVEVVVGEDEVVVGQWQPVALQEVARLGAAQRMEEQHVALLVRERSDRRSVSTMAFQA